MSFEKFLYDEKEFEIRHLNDGTRIAVKVFLNKKQVTPEFGASTETADDFFNVNGGHILDLLKNIAKTEIESGRWNAYF